VALELQLGPVPLHLSTTQQLLQLLKQGVHLQDNKRARAHILSPHVLCTPCSMQNYAQRMPNTAPHKGSIVPLHLVARMHRAMASTSIGMQSGRTAGICNSATRVACTDRCNDWPCTSALQCSCNAQPSSTLLQSSRLWCTCAVAPGPVTPRSACCAPRWRAVPLWWRAACQPGCHAPPAGAATSSRKR
jgi:hypothetical protein